ncbi:TIGR00730 family Rossman fold protein [Weissella muntiaci]|uniref:Cytokinin riboside 5'-monophosphate phosphoribohydrolase n=1 Tax=Weissella muntiaci TaxID=2508881 RepID=A0A6C2C6H9_9LACO|nr:TIGR00730 family Rossman fold protein [Weissella muntiaci]TYC48915.1 TIGR00730 family Rossman fold protein [Weissella muntiaci]
MASKTIGVFMGAHDGENPNFKKAALEVGAALAQYHYNLVYGGSATGLMGTVARSAKANGVYVTGIHPDNLIPEQAGPELSDNYIQVTDMSVRKDLMFKSADAYLFMPGGLGTLEELSQVLSWTKLGIYNKPLVLLNLDGYYTSLAQWIEHSALEGFESFTDINQYALVNDVASAFEHFAKKFDL